MYVYIYIYTHIADSYFNIESLQNVGPEEGNAQKVTFQSLEGDLKSDLYVVSWLDPLLRFPFSGPVKEVAAGTFFRAVLAQIRRLRKSPQYFLQGNMTVSANLRDSPQNFHNHCAEKYQNPGSRNSLECPHAFLSRAFSETEPPPFGQQVNIILEVR